MGGQRMRDRDAIDEDLRLIATLRRTARHQGGQMPLTERIDALLDERLEVADELIMAGRSAN
ncbi:MAG: hypothetical protein QOD90_276 [Mycobacterium sp.]|jgi:hypothetical protein|nr:hypothetical protein [Mycobacterium sp.]